MRVLASLSTVAVTTLILASCGLDMGGLGDVATEGGPTLDSSSTAEGGSSGGSSGGASSGGDDGSSGDGSASGSGSGGADSTAPDSSVAETGSPVDSSTPDTYVVEAGPPPCTVANNCYVIPSSWQLVAFTTGTSAPTANCPNGFATAQPTNLDEGPITSGACSCAACTTSTQPTCPSGPIQVAYDQKNLPGSGQCGTAGNPSTQDNKPNGPGGCDTDMYTGNIPTLGYAALDLKYTPPDATGGQCASAGTESGTVTYSAQDRTCMPDSQASAGCVGNQCTLTLGSPYQVCVFQSGAQGCPGTPFTHQHFAGTGTMLTCSSCGCNVTATCSGTMKLFTANNCSTTGGQQEDDIAADGQCHSSNTGNNTFQSYEYAGNPPAGVACNATGTSNAQNVTLQNEETICCTQ